MHKTRAHLVSVPCMWQCQGRKMVSTSMYALLLLFAFWLYPYLAVAQQEQVAGSEREALEIIIGGGGDYGPAPKSECPSPPPPEPECPPLPPPPPPCNPFLQRAQKVLLSFKLNVEDPTGYTKNWKEGEDTCKFNGVRCAQYPKAKELAVAGIDLNQAAIYGRNGKDLALSDFLGSIPELTFFHVNSNNFSGALPNLAIVNFTYFYELDLSNNKLSGEFPKQVLEAKELVFLDLRFNRLNGPIPRELFEMDLDVIFINNNCFSGCLPDNFGRTPARFLTLANNLLTGPIPHSIGRAYKTLTEVLFLGNKLDGCLPFEIGYLNKATVFDVSNNCLEGIIPLSFACLEKIQFLNLAHNRFYDEVPEMVCCLPGLRNNGNLSLSDNYFTRVGPKCRELIDAKVLDVSNNCIRGLPNQRPEKDCNDFFSKPLKRCPNRSYIPCPVFYSSLKSQSQTPPAQKTASPPAPVTYSALDPHRS